MESDRTYVYNLIGAVWGKPSEDREACIDRFDHFVRESLQVAVKARVGGAARIPYLLNLLVHVPISLWLVMDVLICDGDNCQSSAHAQGFTSAAQYISTNVLMNSAMALLVFPWSFPAMLTAMSWVEGKTATSWRFHLQAAAVLCVIAANSLACGFSNQAIALCMTGEGSSFMILSLFANGLLLYIFFVG